MKEEEHYAAVLNYKDQVTRLTKSLKQEKQGSNNNANDRELAKLSVENELLRKQIEDLKMN